MDDATFHDLVGRSDAVADPAATSRATIATLGDVLGPDRAGAVATWLPAQYASDLEAVDDPERLGHEAFLDRVCEREGANPGPDDEETDVRARVGAVVDAIATAVPAEVLADLRTQVPDPLGPLFVTDVADD